MPQHLIYHYTDLAGLMGILESKTLWATDLRFLNDTTEIRFGKERVNELFALDVPSRDPVPAALRIFYDAWPYYPADHRLFVACFCTNGDLLSQWRGYGRLGYSIGCDRKALEHLGQGRADYALHDMVYSIVEQQRQVSAILDEFVQIAPTHLGGKAVADLPSSPALEAIMSWTIKPAMELAQLEVQFKHDSFEEEHEVRAIRVMQLDVPEDLALMRTRGTHLGPTPYVSLDIGKSPATTAIREIIVGPAPHQALACDGVRDLARSHGLAEVEVKPSPIPFRW